MKLTFKKLLAALLLAISVPALAADYYGASGDPATGSALSSSVLRSEYSAIATGFTKVAPYTGNANKAVIINSGGTAQTVTTGTLALAGNFATTGAFNTTLVQGATTSLTLPLVNGTLAILGANTFTGLQTFNAGISVPTGQNVTGAGTAQVTGFATVSGTTLTGTLSTAAQANVTSLGTLTGLTVTNAPTFSAMTATRVPYFGTAGLLSDSSVFTFTVGTGTLAATTFSGALTGNASTATALATARAIYGNNFDGTAALAQIIASTYGGTGNGFTKFSGPTTAEKTFTLPDASATLLYSGGDAGTPSALVGTNISGTAASLTAGVASAVAASGITGTTLAAGVTASSLTSLGTVTALLATQIGLGTATAANSQLKTGGNFSPAVGGAGVGILIETAIVEAGSGTHGILAGIVVSPTFTAGTADVTTAAGISISTFAANATTTTAVGLQVAAPTGGSANYAINITSGDIYKAGSAYTNPDYVLEHWATGKIVKFADKEGAQSYAGLQPLTAVVDYMKTHLVLPRIHDWRNGKAGSSGWFGGGDALLASVEEGYLYLADHESRLRTLEARLK